MYSLKNKNIIVTGAARGLGKSISENLAKKQLANVICLDKDIIKSNIFSDNYKIDFSKTKSLEKNLQKILNKYNKIDGLVNCAAVTLPEKKFPKKDFTSWKKTMSVNLDAVFVICSAVCNFVIKKKHKLSIVNFTSIGGHLGFPKNSAYCSSKGAILQLTKSLSCDYGSFGIRANCIVPGYFNTPMNNKSWNSIKERKKRSNKTNLNRWGKPEEICGPVNFLLSEESSYVTGADIVVDGGWLSKGL
ncbi:SDR family oxidoreductase [Candidatus Pelagibacter sp.]|jgi:2-dehydro-3-deoxy-D-gluconate 5-dehydrogenase|nr:SDR family oxidoreductase [Candidatus Pelagibacter sp.]